MSELIYRLPGKIEKRIANYELIENQMKNYYKNIELIAKIKEAIDKKKNPKKYLKKKQEEEEEEKENNNEDVHLVDK